VWRPKQEQQFLHVTRKLLGCLVRVASQGA
jgi:hypothetical protein